MKRKQNKESFNFVSDHSSQVTDDTADMEFRNPAYLLFKSYNKNRLQCPYIVILSIVIPKWHKNAPFWDIYIVGSLFVRVCINDIKHSSSKLKYVLSTDDTNLLPANKDICSVQQNLKLELESVKSLYNIQHTFYIRRESQSVPQKLISSQNQGTFFSRYTEVLKLPSFLYQ